MSARSNKKDMKLETLEGLESRITGKEHAPSGAGEVIRLSWLADIRNILEGIIEDHDLYKTGKGSSDYLGHEHGTWRDLHVVAELQVGYECQGLRHGDVTKSFETALVSAVILSRERNGREALTS